MNELECDILIFFATTTEKEQLEHVASELGIPFQKKKDSRLGRYYHMGVIGSNRVRAVQTKMGSFFHQASASQAIRFLNATSAKSIIQVGMAFGIDRSIQNYGDVLVSEWIFPYDYRIVEHCAGNEHQPESYRNVYQKANRFVAKEQLVTMLTNASLKDESLRVHSGGLLSGGARIRSQRFLRDLLEDVTDNNPPGGYIGGEMEGVGLLAACDSNDPIWVVVKGISDFADDSQQANVKQYRETACRNAAMLVLRAIQGLEQSADEMET
ncbi:5'-methylthioadenosine/S-adenosylhomocysteine nucleosidase family protein [Tuwongella immobilis]|uniref:Nucleoside phosphorylase domain-containing protein n=1 Tax=Tuwongella immobilis TaxID=692036 RepID=A0A6C2YIE4_9BACT|nr:hypothetical protein [Tuwongella immobilis]VIP01308.1 nucleoside phosphorylase-like protein : Uncharacterized protein OS=Stigmatella aurantiaca (strain DW4/3-1) GN=STAUR_0573 PE=4 SV=1: PNP_UDP_1 [Tuwongella immobilis]VTR98042.1 nucleoside phosphorylase-like protein : Uncharacterized protein OS=Stigmatella aurantiaca (strain DW4/3-1) GN=STAUR_0573 PE=4 SV=1: PNP_UDP_1 [Tuwongella immobilis]